MRAITGYGGPVKRPQAHPSADARKKWDEPMPWPKSEIETRGSTPLANVSQILEAGRQRRAVTLKPHA